MREHVTTLLDVLGVLLLAAGAALAAAPYLGGAAVAVAGVVVLVGSWLGTRGSDE